MNSSNFIVNASVSFLNDTVSSNNISLSNVSSFSQQDRFSDGLRFVFITLMLAILIMIIFGNILIILVICIHKQLHTTTNIFITNLAVGDLFLAIAVVPFDIDKLVRGYFAFDTQICEFASTAFFFSLPASAVNLLIMTFERFCAIRFPFKHRAGQMFTKKRNVVILLTTWLYIGFTASLPVLGWRSYPTVIMNGECFFHFEIEYAVYLLVANFIFPLLFIVVMNLWILYIAKDRHRMLAENITVRYRASTKNNSVNLVKKKTSKLTIKREKLRRQSTLLNDASRKATKIIAILVGTFVFCWLPYIINVSANIICRGCSPHEIGQAVLMLVYANSAINPVLYGVYKPQIRELLKAMLIKVSRSFQRKRNPHGTDKDIELTYV